MGYLQRRLQRGARRLLTLSALAQRAPGPVSDTSPMHAVGAAPSSAIVLVPAPRLPPRLKTLGIVIAVLWLTGAWFVLAFNGTPSHLGGWWKAALAFTPAVVVTLLVVGLRWELLLPATIAIAMALGALAYVMATPGFDRLGAVTDGAPAPASWELVTEEAHGNDWCLQGCPELYRVYQTNATPTEVTASYGATLEDAGWRPSTDPNASPSRLASGRWTKRGVIVDVSVPGPAGRDYPPAVPDHLTKVEVVIKSR